MVEANPSTTLITHSLVSKKLVANVHAMLAILAFLSRPKKFQLQGLNKAFCDHVVFKSLISARFIGHDVVTNSSLLNSVVQKTRKLLKLEL